MLLYFSLQGTIPGISCLLKGANISGNALVYAFHLLAMHLEVQEKAYEEIQAIRNGRPLLSDIPQMIYSLCIMYETVRLFPVSGFLPRRTVEEVTLGRYRIPKDTSIGPDLVNLHRNEKYWGEDCNEFNPSRFDNRFSKFQTADGGWQTSADGKIKIPKGAFMSFGDGSRVCLGMLSSSPS
jgi:cytochrome P450